MPKPAAALLLACGLSLAAGTGIRAEDGFHDYSRLMIYDIRGVDYDETAIVIEQSGSRVTVWLKDYLGQRRGEMPLEDYLAAFQGLQNLKEFAQNKKYRGKLLRAHAAHGTVTLAWKNGTDKQIKSIRYYAPEHMLDDFRNAFNRAWALSRYAILSRESFQSPKWEWREDAVYFASGAGWLTANEIDSVMAFHRRRGAGREIAAAIWAALDQPYPAASEFSKPSYLEYCVTKSMQRLGEPAYVFLKTAAESGPSHCRALAGKILSARTREPLATK